MNIAIATILILACLANAGCGEGSKAEPDDSSDSDAEILYYKSPMDPSFVSERPGKDAMGMDLVPVHKGDPGADLSSIVVDGATVQNMGIRTATVRRQPLSRLVRALGRLEFDETRVSTVNMKFDGWIEHLWVDQTGQFVEKGARLFSVYSPELVASQHEYLLVLRSAAGGPHSEQLKEAARDRLLQFDVPESFVDSLRKTGKARRNVTMRSPARGYVVHKTALEGTFVTKGASLFKVADLDALWVIAEVFEFDAPWVVIGQDATIELDYLPGRMQEAKVDYIYPTLNEKTRTLEVRLLLPNPQVDLKPGMFATVRIHTNPVGNALVVPSEAVILSGERAIAFVSKGQGRFEPRTLELGVRGDEAYQVISGIEEGEQIVTSGQFLLDSESQLKAVVLQMLGSNVDADEPATPDAAPKKMDAMEMDATSPMSEGQAETKTRPGDSGMQTERPNAG